MCEQLLKYDCGHLHRRTIRCTKLHEQHKPHPSATCFSSQSLSKEEHCHETKKLERQATLCPKCERQGKDREVYVNSPQRTNLPTTETKQDSNSIHGKEQCVVEVSTSTGFSVVHPNPTLLPPHRLRRVRATGNSSLRNEYNRLETPRDSETPSDRDNSNSSRHTQQTRLELPQGHELKPHHSQDTSGGSLRHEYTHLERLQNSSFEAHRDQKPRPRDLIMPGLELDCYASSYVPLHERTPLSGTSFANFLDHSQSRSDESRTPSSGTIRSETKPRKRLQKKKSMYQQTESSNESFVCSGAREIEKGGS